MATRVNRAATSVNKQGGKSARKGARNRTAQLGSRYQPLGASQNRRAFQAQRHETLARHRNAAMGIPTQEVAPGVPVGRDITLKHRAKRGRLPRQTVRFQIWSDAFGNRERIPRKYTQDGENISPPITWGCANLSAQEYALVCEDVSVEGRNPVVHWLIYRIPGHLYQLPENILPGEKAIQLRGGPLQGLNDDGVVGYTGPFPPLYDGWHHYRFRLFALDRNIRGLKPGMTFEELYERIIDHVLQETEFSGRYRRTRGTLKRIPGAE